MQVSPVPRRLRTIDSPEEGRWWLHLHPPDAARILRRDGARQNWEGNLAWPNYCPT